MGALLDFLLRPDFLQSNMEPSKAPLPLVHTTRSCLIKKIMRTNEIRVSYCDVFNENLNYFFVARPGYKHQPGSGRSSYWELPTCFIMKYDSVPDAKRIFPFDSGSFKKGLMPTYMNILDLDDFKIEGIPDAPQRIIGAFFSDAGRYFSLQPKSSEQFETEFSLHAFDEEVKALHLLASQEKDQKLDDRRFCIEIQSEKNIGLTAPNVLAVICPSIYLDYAPFKNHVEKVWEAEPITYSIFPLNYRNYISEIYAKVAHYYISNGLI